jgi:hypothetical protein
MSVFTGYRDRRHEISMAESVDTLDHMEDFFGDGQNWAQHVYDGKDGGKCLVAAAEYVRVSSIDDAKHWLRMAIKEKTGLTSIEQFNDTRSTYDEVAAVIARAKQLALAGQRAGSVSTFSALVPVRASTPVVEILPPERKAAPATVPATIPSVRRAPMPAPYSAPYKLRWRLADAACDLRRSLAEWDD